MENFILSDKTDDVDKVLLWEFFLKVNKGEKITTFNTAVLNIWQYHDNTVLHRKFCDIIVSWYYHIMTFVIISY